MEEETARVAQGQVPEMESFVMTQKDALPASINAIFSPPENFTSPNPPAEVAKETNGIEPDQELRMPMPVAAEGPPQPLDYDSDEGVGADISVEKGKDDYPEPETNPTDAEVDAALAELDSIPDAGCEAGDVDDDDEEEEEWSYFKMEPRKHAQNEDLIPTGSSENPLDLPTGEAEDSSPHSPRALDSPSFVKESSPSGSPQAPSSPRTVEGFVTSVELNTPEESYNTNLAINQSTEYFNGGQIEQSSGPFSVYVSNSPEPTSIDSPPANVHSPVMSPTPPDEIGEESDDEIKAPLCKDEHEVSEGQSVEIVHAQSTVEVLTEIPQEVENLMKEEPTLSSIPDIMTQSITGDLPTEPYIPSEVIEDAQQFLDGINQQDRLERAAQEQLSAVKETIETNIEKVMNTVEHFQTDLSPIELAQEFGQKVASPILDTFEDNIADGDAKDLLMPSAPEPINVTSEFDITVPERSNLEAEAIEDRFTDEINKAFEAPLDQMITSFHEERLQDNHLISSTTPLSPNEVAPQILSPVLAPATQLIQAGVDTLVDQISQLEIEEETTVVETHVTESPVIEHTVPEPPIIESPVVESPVLESPLSSPVMTPKLEAKKPSSAPRTTSLKSAPPKPSPRSVGSKPAVSKIAPSTGPSPGTRGPTKRPTSLSATATSKPLRKPEAARPSTTTSTARTRLSTTTTTTASRVPSSATRTTTTMKTTTSATASAARTKVAAKSSLPSARAKPAVGAAAAPKTTTSAAPKPRPSPVTSTTATRRLTSAPKPAAATTLTTSTSRLSSSASRTSTGASSLSKTAPKPSTTSSSTLRPSSLNATKKPLPAKTTTTTTTRTTSGTATRKPLAGTATRPSTMTTLKQRNTTSAPPATKDSKNSTNRMLSTTKTTTTTKMGTSPSSRITTATTKRTSLSKTTKTTGLKAKVDKSPLKMDENAMANGENKIVDEESSVEVKDKMMEEESVESSEKMLTETVSTVSGEVIEGVSVVEDLLSLKENILVNGNH